MACTKQHRYDPQYNNLPIDQGSAGIVVLNVPVINAGYLDGVENSYK